MNAFAGDRCLGRWIRTDLGVRTFQGLGRNGSAREQVVRRITNDLHTRHVLEDLLCDSQSQVPLHRRCLPDCGPTMSQSRDIQTVFVYRLFPRLHGPDVPSLGLQPSRFPSGGGGFRLLFQVRIHASGHFSPQYLGQRHCQSCDSSLRTVKRSLA